MRINAVRKASALPAGRILPRGLKSCDGGSFQPPSRSIRTRWWWPRFTRAPQRSVGVSRTSASCGRHTPPPLALNATELQGVRQHYPSQHIPSTMNPARCFHSRYPALCVRAAGKAFACAHAFFLSPTLTFLQPLPCRFRVPLRRWEQVIAPEGADRCGVLVRVGEADVAGGCGTCRALVRHSRAQGGLARRRDTDLGTGGVV